MSLLSGFAVNLQVILANPRAQFKRRGSQPGMQESDFLKQITKVTELEPKANNCTRVSKHESFWQRNNLIYLIYAFTLKWRSPTICSLYYIVFISTKQLNKYKHLPHFNSNAVGCVY